MWLTRVCSCLWHCRNVSWKPLCFLLSLAFSCLSLFPSLSFHFYFCFFTHFILSPLHSLFSFISFVRSPRLLFLGRHIISVLPSVSSSFFLSFIPSRVQASCMQHPYIFSQSLATLF